MTMNTGFAFGSIEPSQKAFGGEFESHQIGYLVFGRSCGECHRNCVVLFRFEKIGDQWTMFADLDSKVWPGEGKADFRTNFSDPWKLQVAHEIVNRMPPQIRDTAEEKTRFGCPDCHDECGYYVEYSELPGGKIKKFWLDYKASPNVPKEVTDYAIFVGEQIRMLGK
jgi:hypothetical protein